MGGFKSKRHKKMVGRGFNNIIISSCVFSFANFSYSVIKKGTSPRIHAPSAPNKP